MTSSIARSIRLRRLAPAILIAAAAFGAVAGVSMEAAGVASARPNQCGDPGQCAPPPQANEPTDPGTPPPSPGNGQGGVTVSNTSGCTVRDHRTPIVGPGWHKDC